MENINLAGFHFHGRYAKHITFFIANQIKRRPLHKKLRVGAHILLIKRVQHGMAGTVGHGAGALYRTFAVLSRMAAKRTLIDFAAFHAVKRHAHVLQLNHRFGCAATHKFNGILIAQPVRPFYGVIHMPIPAVFLHIAQRGGNAALRSYGVRTGGKHFRQNSGIQTGFGQLQCGAQTGTAAADNHGIKLANGKTHTNPQITLTE